MQSDTPRPRRARPVADAPIDALLGCSEELAKGWLLALVEQQPLASAASILAAELASEGPSICSALLRALGADSELARIRVGGELERLVSRVGELAGARSPEQVSLAVNALRAVIWSALLQALPDPDADQVAALAERLALIGEVVRGAALRALAEHVGGEAAPVAEWPRVLDRELARSRRTGAALSLLQVELEDADRILAVEPVEVATAIFDRFAQAVRRSVRPADLVVAEGATRAWVIAPDTDRAAAAVLGSWLAGAIRGAEPWRGAPLGASVGVAVLGEDSDQASGLIEAAEEARFTAAASGIEVTRGPNRS